MTEQPTPNALWRQAHVEHPDDKKAALDLYRTLMLKAGHLVPRKPGEDRRLPCGVDLFDPSLSGAQEATDG